MLSKKLKTYQTHVSVTNDYDYVVIGELNTRRFVEQRLILTMNQSIRVTFLTYTMYREMVLIEMVLWCRVFSGNVFIGFNSFKPLKPKKVCFFVITLCLPVKCMLLFFRSVNIRFKVH